MKSPFPWFGGKSKVSDLVWDRFGDVPNYCEPFFGSGAVLLNRPTEPGTETINDLDCMVANFWRALKYDPEEVSFYADSPVNEADQHARHLWLCSQEAFRERMKVDPEFYDTKIAGWWVWGQCIWIGSGWCYVQLPHLGDAGTGIHRKLPHLGDAGTGIHRKLPHLGNAGTGIHRKRPHLGDAGTGIHRKRPHLGDAGKGINRQLPHLGDAGKGINRQLPHLGDAGTGIHRKLPHLGDAGTECVSDRTSGTRLIAYMQELSDRLSRVRVCCGDWARILGPSVTFKHGVTGVFLDPPYADTAGRTNDLYSSDSNDVAHEVRKWALANGNNPLLRIALCGYEGEHDIPDTWDCVEWKAKGGYGSQGENDARENSKRERVWFSPHCLRPQMRLFA